MFYQCPTEQKYSFGHYEESYCRYYRKLGAVDVTNQAFMKCTPVYRRFRNLPAGAGAWHSAIVYVTLPPKQCQPAFSPSTTLRIGRGRGNGRRRSAGARKTTIHLHQWRIAAIAKGTLRRGLRRDRFSYSGGRDLRYGGNAASDAEIPERVFAAVPVHSARR